MTWTSKIRTAAKEWISSIILPEEFTVGLPDPQTEVTVWLLGMGEPIDVTYSHSTVCADPFTLCIALDPRERPHTSHPILRFSERDGEHFILGEITLRYKTHLFQGGMNFYFFEPHSVRNFCFPEAEMYVHLAVHLYRLRKAKSRSAISMSFLHRRAAMVSFIRPHHTVLVSVQGPVGENIFPMNLMGQLGPSHFGFALRHDRCPATIIEHTRHLTISNVPLEQAPLAYSYTIHHTMESIAISELPFQVRPSPTLKVSVPEFAPRVREFEVLSIQKMGSHTFFIARLLHDEVISETPSLSVIHGFYQSWRLRQKNESPQQSLAQNRFHKYG